MLDPEIETKFRAADPSLIHIAGIDEVGRGPWAGPVTACAVVLDPNNIPDGLNDSKALTARMREALYQPILDSSDVGLVHVSVEVIDEINILQASLLAMRLALGKLQRPADFALIDGNKTPMDMPCQSQTLVKGDARCLSIAAASIVAKVTRDRLMVALSQQHPGYGWERNAGYGTKQHILALNELGVTQHHRRSFKPIHKMLCEGNYSTS